MDTVSDWKLLSGVSRRAFVSSFFCFALICLFVPNMATASEGADSKTPDKKTDKLEVSFENVAPDLEEMGRKIIAVTAERFEKTTGTTVGKIPIRVRFVSKFSAGDAGRFLSGQVKGVKAQGMMIPGKDVCTIEISTNRSWSYGRILAHEVTHVFIHEAYGRVLNRTLNEGMAEYMAGLEFPSEIQQSINAATRKGFVAKDLQPYIEGHRFCSSFATDDRFPSFFAGQIANTDARYSQLKEAWNNQ